MRTFRHLTCFWLTILSSGCEHVEKVEKTESIENEGVEKTAAARITISGKNRFEGYCAACHQLGGQGTEGRVPPLNGSPWVSGSEGRLIRIVLHGLRGPIEIGGLTYNLEMPAFGPLFTDAEIASLLSYVRQQYGRPSPPVSATTVRQIRKGTRDRTSYWTVAELMQVP